MEECNYDTGGTNDQISCHPLRPCEAPNPNSQRLTICPDLGSKLTTNRLLYQFRARGLCQKGTRLSFQILPNLLLHLRISSLLCDHLIIFDFYAQIFCRRAFNIIAA